MADMSILRTWDYISLFIIFFGTFTPGIYNIFNTKKSTNVREFLVLGKGLGTISIMLSMAATMFVPTFLIALPTDTYRNGAVLFWFGISGFFGGMISALLHIPVFVNLKVSSIFEYFELRYNIYARLIFAGANLLQDILFNALMIFATSQVISYVCNSEFWIGTGILSAVTITYTAIGGFKTVVWTDVAQSAVIALTIIIILTKGCLDLGGVEEIWKINKEGKRTELFIMEQGKNSAYTIWTMVIGSTFNWLAFFCSQSQIQRCVACGSTKKAARTAFGSGVVIAGSSLLVSSFGLLIYSKYHDCDPLMANEITAYDQIMALFAIETLESLPGLSGIYLAGLLSAAISSLSSVINSASCVIMEDFVIRNFKSLKDLQLVTVSKIITVVYGLLSVAAMLLIQKSNGILQAIFVIKGVITGPQIGFYTIGMLSPWTSTRAAFLGYLSSVSFMAWISIGALLAKPLLPSAPISISGCNLSLANAYANSTTDFNRIVTTAQSYAKDEPFYLYTFHPAWYTCWSVTIVVVVGLCATIFAPQDPEKTDPKFLFPFVINIINFLPNTMKLRLGFDPINSKYIRHKKIPNEYFEDQPCLQEHTEMELKNSALKLRVEVTEISKCVLDSSISKPL